MQITPADAGPEKSVTAQTRRAQIVAATIDTIAELGYAQTSFARIAERAGLSSTRLISYHFAGKQELVGQVVTEVYHGMTEFMRQRLADQTTAAGGLRAYIEGYIEFVATHRTQMKALLGIFLSGTLSVNQRETGLVTVQPVQQLLVNGQESGEFRMFDPMVVAAAIQRSLDGVPMLIESRPDLDPAECARELATVFELATRA
ncbi:MAG: TetR family transcriptional regulator [Catenulispora sp.]|nr:TetR family transcriptional regulator [Catenulispora sp.]